MCQIIETLDHVFNQVKIVDLSYTLHPDMPTWPTQPRFQSNIYASQEYGDGSFHCSIHMSEHTGTHVDAPKHFIVGGKPINQVDIRQLIGRGVRIDATDVPDCKEYTLDQLRHFEEINGPIRQGDIVLIRFGWDLRYGLRPEGSAYLENWPGLSPQCAAYLQSKGVRAVGCDTLALDPYPSADYPCHSILLGDNILILENLCNLGEIPTFSYIIGLPHKFYGGSGSPLRIIALCEEGV